MHKVESLSVDTQLRDYSEILQDRNIIRKLCGVDIISINARYHSKCLKAYKRKANKIKEDMQATEQTSVDLDDAVKEEHGRYDSRVGVDDILETAALVLREHTLETSRVFFMGSFTTDSQLNSVPKVLYTFVRTIIEEKHIENEVLNNDNQLNGSSPSRSLSLNNISHCQ